MSRCEDCAHNDDLVFSCSHPDGTPDDPKNCPVFEHWTVSYRRYLRTHPRYRPASENYQPKGYRSGH
jgi:hypothetical protein